MRVFSRFALVAVILVLIAPSAFAEHLRADCPLTLVASDPAPLEAIYASSPHGVFRSDSQVFVVRGGTLSTYTVNETGDLQLAREDLIPSLGAGEPDAGVAFSNGFLYISSDAGLEVFDLRGVRVGGTAPVFVSRTAGLHYRRLAASGNTLAGVFPATDLGCSPNLITGDCANTVDLISIANTLLPQRVGTIRSNALSAPIGAINDILFIGNTLFAAGTHGSFAFNVASPAAPFPTFPFATGGTFLVTNGTNLVGIGNDSAITLYPFSTITGVGPALLHYTLPGALRIDRINPIAFHPQVFIDDAAGRLVTMVDEIDPLTLHPARTIAFVVYDFNVPGEGSAPRPYESITILTPDEVKFNPVSVGGFVYTVGELSGLQTWGACGQATGRIEFGGTQSLTCGGAEIHGWVTGTQRISTVELYLGSTRIGGATIGPTPRIDIGSRTPVYTWRVANVNLDLTARGEQTLRAVATDSLGVRRQIASQQVFFPGPPNNCAIGVRARAAGR